jgi:hypothetical protein
VALGTTGSTVVSATAAIRADVAAASVRGRNEAPSRVVVSAFGFRTARRPPGMIWSGRRAARSSTQPRSGIASATRTKLVPTNGHPSDGRPYRSSSQAAPSMAMLLVR